MAVSKKVKRDVSKSKSWFQRTSSQPKRKTIAGFLKHHRKAHFSLIIYFRYRDLKWLKKHGFDLEAWVKARIPRKRRLYLLEAGPGFSMVGAGLKNSFGDKVFVTALNVLRPQLTKELEQKMAAEIEAEEKPETKARMQRRLKQMHESEKNRKLVDEYRVSPIETFSSKRKYDAILDLYGPLYYTQHPVRTLERYLHLLKPNGKLFADEYLFTNYNILTENLRTLFGPKGKLAKKTGYYFKRTKIPNSKIWELKKTKAKYFPHSKN